MAAPQTPAAATRPIDRILSPVQAFLKVEAAGGILLLACTAFALLWANSPWSESYTRLWQTVCTVGIGDFVLSKPLILWVNDGLMAVFFFVVGLEIKRELLVGELASMRKAAVPIVAAIGGMALPALFYALVNLGGDAMDGWAVPAATDIAFALGIMAMLGPRVPVSLKIFLTALAIVDDLGAVLVIAVFYTSGVSLAALGAGGGILAALVAANLVHIRRPVVYFLLGIALWVALLLSGVHATVAGVLVAFTIPARIRMDEVEYVAFSRRALQAFEAGDSGNIMTSPERQGWVHALEEASEHVLTPLNRLEHRLHGFVAFFVMPVFALANAGVILGDGLGAALTSRVALGIGAGLLLGKQVGILLFAWLAVRLGLGEVPEGSSWRQIHAVSWLAGIGFTMSLFVAGLGLGEGALLEQAKIGILASSLVAGVGGFLLLRAAIRSR